MSFPPDYAERVYAGILGKIIGVYLGRPFEGWTHERILADLGEIGYYVNHRKDLPLHNHQLVVTDDDISGTFTFLRALPDYGHNLDLSPAQIGQTWLNYIIENRAILWWGGMGNSTEHTAYLRLKDGIQAPRSGSMDLNGKVVSEQIGAQIFIEGWGLISPGDPEQAADLAKRAASVSHDGEAIYGAQVIAALTAQAFIESNLDRLLDTAVSLIPSNCLVSRLITEIREWHNTDPQDWYGARARLAAKYGYQKYGGNCHIIPNHGLVILSLLYSGGDFSRAQTIVNTCGWDTDCNAANVGCILGVRNGLAAFDSGPDWRGPVADQLYIPTADGGRSISDAVLETSHVLSITYALKGEKWEPPKGGARFHFSYPGSVQGFRAQGVLRLDNRSHPSEPGRRVLAMHYDLEPGDHSAALTPTFIPPDALEMPGYEMLASPTLYPGQVVRAELVACQDNPGPVKAAVRLGYYGENDRMATLDSPQEILAPGDNTVLEWQVPDLGAAPVAKIGVTIHAHDRPASGIVYLDYLSWSGTPQVTFRRPENPGQMWIRQWVDAVDGFSDRYREAFRVIQNRGRGLAITGTREWADYQVRAALTPHLAAAFGLAVRVQGLERYYALLLADRGTVRLVKRLDGETILAVGTFSWEFGETYNMKLGVKGNLLQAWVDEELIFEVLDDNCPLTCGGIGLVCEQGRISTEWVSVEPPPSSYQ